MPDVVVVAARVTVTVAGPPEAVESPVASGGGKELSSVAVELEGAVVVEEMVQTSLKWSQNVAIVLATDRCTMLAV